MSVYFITARELGLVKIGCTKDTDYRLGVLKTSSPAALKVEAILPGYYDREKELHDQFADYRVRGEWFTITEEIENIIRSAGPLLMPFEKLPQKKSKTATADETEALVQASIERDRRMLAEADAIFAQLMSNPQPVVEHHRFYNVVPVSGGQFGQRFAIRGEGGHRHRLLGADLNLTWDEADRLCELLEEVREYALHEFESD